MESAAAPQPVAGVVVHTPLAHLDRVFDYSVPQAMVADAVPGARVRIRFAGRDLEGFVVERRERTAHDGPLTPLRRVVSPEPVLTPELLRVCRAVAGRYAGTLSDVLRLAVPPRHAAAEKALAKTAPTPELLPRPEPGPWSRYPAGEALLRHIAEGGTPVAVWGALPAMPPEHDWPMAIAVACATALAGGRGALVVVPDGRDVDRVDAALSEVLGRGHHVRLTADQGPQARYTAWLKALRGHVRCVVGTRAAAFAPVAELGLLVCWDDGDDLHVEPRAPYPHAREVLRLRARIAGAARICGGFAQSVEMAFELSRGAAGVAAVSVPAGQVRREAPRVLVAGEGALDGEGPAGRAQLPPTAWRAARSAVESGPVLVQVPRGGYLPGLSCQECRAPARCPTCHGPMTVAGHGAAARCRWCGGGFGPTGFQCRVCDGRRVRSTVVGARRTAEELGRAFPGVPVVASGAGEVVARVPARPALVVATPGAEPLAEDGYAATLLLDAWRALERPELDVSLETLRRWLNAAALTRPAGRGGVVVVAGVPEGGRPPAVEALARWDPTWLAVRELAERVELGLPPSVRMAELVGPPRSVTEATAALDVPHLDRLGPLPYRPDPPGDSRPDPGRSGGASERSEWVRTVVRVPLESGAELVAALAALRATRSARKDPLPLLLRVDSVTG